MARRPRKKKSNHHGGHHGGSWKVAYADFVTAMMALFLVLWLVSQGDQKLKMAIANYFREPGAFDTAQGNIFKQSGESTQTGEGKPVTTVAALDDLKALNSTAALLREKISSMTHRDRIRVDMSDEGLHIQILDKADRASFPLGSAELEPATRAILAEIAATICTLPNPIQIGGHTDSYQFPTADYTNWELSADRANAARRELEAACVKPERIRRIVGFADSRPLIVDDPFAAANRRISIMLFFQKVPVKEGATDADKVEGQTPASDKPGEDQPAKEKAKKPAPAEADAPQQEEPESEAPAKARRGGPGESSAAKAAKPVAPVKARPVDLHMQERARRVNKDTE